MWTRSGGVWTQLGGKLAGTGFLGHSAQGYSLALSADGNTAVVGGAFDTGLTGATWVWTLSGGVWTQQGNKLVATDATSLVEQGFSVSASADGNTAVVGGPGDSSNAGAMWVYTRSGGVWSQQGNKLVGRGAVGNPAQGTSVALSSDGNTIIVGGPADASNAGAAWVYANQVDTTPPVIISTITGTLGSNGWYTSAVSLSWAVSDPESGIASQSGCDPVTLTASASVICTATSGARVSNAVTAQVKIDTTPPVITPSIVGTMGANGWYTSAVTLGWSIVDAESSLELESGCLLATLTASSSVTCAATNGAGLATSVTVSVKIDTTPPVVTPTLTGTVGANGWYTSAVSLSWAVSDPESGVASQTGCGPVTWTAGGSATCSATNGAGLSNSATVQVKIDTTPPVITPTITGTLGSNGWYISAVSLTWAVSDPESGVASQSGCGPVTLTASGSVTCTATNGAGLANPATVQVNIDTTPPVITPTMIGTLGPSGSYKSAVSLSWVANDPESGIASQGGCGPVTLTASGSVK